MAFLLHDNMMIAQTIKPFYIVVVFVLNISPTAYVTLRWGHGLKFHQTDW